MINVLAIQKPDAFSIQKAYVSYSFIDIAFKYATITISEELKIICQLIPRSDVHDGFCYLNYSVLQYVTTTKPLRTIGLLQLNVNIRKESIRPVNNIIDAKTIDVSVIFVNSLEVQRWNKNEELLEVVRSILMPYVIINSCFIVVPNSKINRNEILYLHVQSTNIKKSATRITSSTVVNIKQLMSVDKFECQYMNRPRKVIGLQNQIKFLDTIYDANIFTKHRNCDLGIKCIQKVCLFIHIYCIAKITLMM